MEFLIAGAVALNVYATSLIIARALVYRTKLYRPMLWNVVLSVLPVLILGLGFVVWTTLLVTFGIWLSLVVTLPIVAVWLIMLPNSSYLMTELNLSHRRSEDPVPMWFDVILVITLAMSGVANTVLNVFIMHVTYSITRHGDSAAGLITPDALFLTAGVMVLLGFGMYLGRYLRLNSWDLRHPASVVRKLVTHFTHAHNALAGIGFTLTYALFLAIIYFMMVGPILHSLIELEAARAV